MSLKILAISNVNIAVLEKSMKRKGFDVVEIQGYNVWQQVLLDESSPLYKAQPDVALLLLDGTELFEDYSAEFEQFVNNIAAVICKAANAMRSVKFLVSDIDIIPSSIKPLKNDMKERVCEQIWTRKLKEISDKYSNIYVFPLKEVVESIGRDNFYSKKMWYLSSDRLSFSASKILTEKVSQLIRFFEKTRKKCLVLDLDNTLWGGVIGEDGIEGIILSEHKEGARYYDFQKRIKEIKETGVILAICSKNNMEEVETAFKHSSMVLHKNDFAVIKANWEEKYKNIKEIANELNIGLDSIVYIDDNPVEREKVKLQLPMLTVPDFPEDTENLSSFAKEIYNKYFYIFDLFEEDKKRTEMYNQNRQREEAKSLYNNLDDYLKSLEMVMKIKIADEADVPRISQLTQKTNQFNLTTIRYAENQILDLIKSDDYILFVGSVTDKYGDNGKCVLVIIRKRDDQESEIETFLMSCRVMGRKIETAMLQFIEKYLMQHGVKSLTARYIQTQKNTPVAMFYENHGYSIISTNENEKIYRKELKQKIPWQKDNFVDVIFQNKY